MANIEPIERARRLRAIGGKDCQSRLTAIIAHRNEARAITQPRQMAIPYPVRRAELEHRPIPVAHAKRLTACRRGDGVALRMDSPCVEIASRRDKLSRALCAGAAQRDI